MRLLAGLLVTAMLLVSAAVQAATITGLYQVQEPLYENDEQARQQALGRAFATLVWRLTGLRELDGYPQLKQLGADPQSLITGYNHRDGALRVHFDASSVLSLMHAQKLATWGSQRPLLLLWWTQQDNQGQQLFNEAHAQAVQVAERAMHNGLPIRFPLADLQEQLLSDKLRPEQHADTLEQLLQRYAADMFLRVQVTQKGTQLAAHWQLYEQGKLRQGQVAAATQEALADAVFAELADYFVNQYAVLPGAGQTLRVQVNNLTLARLATLEKALQPYNPMLEQVRDQQAIWQVTAPTEQLRNLFALQRMVELPVPAVEPGPLAGQPATEQPEHPAQQLPEAAPDLPDAQVKQAPARQVDLLFGW